MKNCSVRIFIIEDNFVQKKQIQDFTTSYLLENTSLNLEFIDTDQIAAFYKNICNTSFFSSDFFIVDYELLTSFNGIDLAKKILTNHPKAILGFLTAYKDKSYEVINSGISPAGYALKDPHPDVFRHELSSLLNKMIQKLKEYEVNENKITVSIGASIRFIPCEDICFITTIKNERNKLLIQTKKEEYMANYNWKRIKSELSEYKEFRIFRSYIINTKNITQYNRSERHITFLNSISLYTGIRVMDKLIKSMKDKDSLKWK